MMESNYNEQTKNGEGEPAKQAGTGSAFYMNGCVIAKRRKTAGKGKAKSCVLSR